LLAALGESAIVTAALWAGILAGYAIAVPVGAVATYLVALAARSPWRVGAAAALGVATTDGLYALVATVGGVALAGVIAPIATWLRFAAALVLLVLAARTAIEGVRTYRAGGGIAAAGGSDGSGADRSDSEPDSALRAYGRLLAITAVNPATVLYFATVVVGARAAVAQAGAGAGQAAALGADALFVAGAFVASASWQLLLASGGTLLGRAVAGARGRLVTALVSAGVMVVLVAVMVV
jgi:threonine/homoserine/homoserine lactone efflux protein